MQESMIVHCPLCGGAVTMPLEVKSIEVHHGPGKLMVSIGTQFVPHRCEP